MGLWSEGVVKKVANRRNWSLEPSCESRVVNRCTYNEGGESEKCHAVLYENGNLTESCGEPCSFVMRKAGSGDPPFLHSDDLVYEMYRLMMRKSGGF